MAVLKVENLRKTYTKGFIPTKYEVLHGVDFEIKSSSITGFLGRNGAGKTTTLKCILGLNFPDSGTVTFFGEGPLDQKVKSRIGFLPERPYFYEYLTGYEFLRFYGQLSTTLKRRALDDRIDHLLRRVDLTPARDKALRDYSKGMLQRIGLAQALVHEPEFVILDEPLSGLDPDGRIALAEIIQETSRNGTSVFFSSHQLNDAEKLCENLVILKDGKVAYQGSTKSLLETASQGTEVTFFDGSTSRQELVEDADQLQVRIGELLREGARILEVRPQRVTLEEAFVNIAFVKGHRSQK